MTANPHKTRLTQLRSWLQAQALDGFIVPHSDDYQNEFLPACSERLAFLTGFTGSAGCALIFAKRAVLFTDSRYTLQAQQQTQATLIVNEREAWLQANLSSKSVLGYDPWLHSVNELESWQKIAAQRGTQLKAITPNPIDKLWTERPPPPQTHVWDYPDSLSGASTQDKLEGVIATLKQHSCTALVLTSPLSVCWLFNLRADDIPHTPVCLARAVIYANGSYSLFINEARYPDSPYNLTPEDAWEESVARLATDKKARLWLDARSCPSAVYETLRHKQANIYLAPDPCLHTKACKTNVEISGARNAHVRDGYALIRFLAWLDQQPPDSVDELEAGAMLTSLRQRDKLFLQNSFPPISAAAQHGAIVHYQATATSTIPLQAGSLYLIDSGGHYRDGTTDVTRTVFIGSSTQKPTATMKRHYTLVLKGHLALMQARFPAGTSGAQLDALARQHLLREGLNYGHGTGHGVGSVLSVHEHPPSLAPKSTTPLHEGMILSNEPGYYKEGHYGIRIENLMVVRPQQKTTDGLSLHCFESLTLVPYDSTLIDPALLSEDERAYLKQYYQRIDEQISPLLTSTERSWLEGQLSLVASFC
ncbi:MAG: aminopeptidase P family protein [Alphaproteobacteria bacterium GM202ARS2]|nr:aminopeptidase P family protein [Alphaproteobacteria bacterium GM202ARS2]